MVESPTQGDPLKQYKTDFRNFLFLCWKHLGLPKPTKIQYDIAEFLQHGPRRKMVQAFRGVGKTWVTSAYIVWRLMNNPDLKIMVVSAAKNHADKTSSFCRQIINTVPGLEYLRPKEGQKDSMIQFEVGPAKESRDPSVTSVGINGQLTGGRADLILSDDVEIPNNSQTQTMRDKIRTAVEEYAAILKPGGEIIYLGTPQCEDTLYRTLKEKGYTVRVWPARYPDPKNVEAYEGQLAPLLSMELEKNSKLSGKPTDPQRFTDADLLEREAEYARSGFQLQFMLDTRLSNANRYPLKLADLIVMGLDSNLGPEKVAYASSPDLVCNDLPNVGMSGDRLYRPMFISKDFHPYTGAVLAIDPAGRGKDETGYCVVKVLHGWLFVTCWGGLRGGYTPENLTKLAQIARDQKVNEVIVESNFGDGMFTQLLTPHLQKWHPCAIEEVRHSVQKEKRIIDTLEPLMNQHRLVIDRKVIEGDFRSTQEMDVENPIRYQGLFQLTRITRDKGSLSHDDRLDALAIAVAYWVESMARDTDRSVEETKGRLADERLKSFFDHVIGKSRFESFEEATWIKF